MLLPAEHAIWAFSPLSVANLPCRHAPVLLLFERKLMELAWEFKELIQTMPL